MDKDEFEKLKLIYETVYDELNRSRDWPIKIMAFTSAAYLAMFSLLKLDNNHMKVGCEIKFIASIFLLALLILTILIIVRQHKNYLRYRNVQINLQNLMKIHDWETNGEEILPIKWKKQIEVSVSAGFVGWFFYAFYIFTIAIITGVLIWTY